MSKWRKSEQPSEPEWKPTKADADKLREELKKFPTSEVNGHKQYPIELHMRSKGIIDFDEFGRRVISSPFTYKRVDDTHGLMQWWDEQEQEKLFQAFPEERVAYEKKMAEMFKSTKELLAQTKVIYDPIN